jgi:hypothetical protein
MKYTKPAVVSTYAAIQIIQSLMKGMYTFPDSSGDPADIRPTNGAYEADE